MKKAFAIFLAVIMLAVFALPMNALAAEPGAEPGADPGPGGMGVQQIIWEDPAVDLPGENARYQQGVWGQMGNPVGDYDAQLDGRGIPDGAQIFRCFTITGDTFRIVPEPSTRIPHEIVGLTKVDGVSALRNGTWCSLEIELTGADALVVDRATEGDTVRYHYLIVLSDTDYMMETEEVTYDFRVPSDIYDSIVANGANDDQTGFNGVWPYGMYAEEFTGQNYDGEINTINQNTGITEGALIFSLYAFDFATFTVTPWGEGPEEIEGYTEVDNPGNLQPGEWCRVVTGGGWTYIFLVPHDGYVHLAEGQVYTVGLPEGVVVDYGVFSGTAGASLLRIVVICIILTFPLGVIVWKAQTRELKNRGRTFSKPVMMTRK